jgi:tetratricopeptide (TPR) repeat protein
MEVVDGVSSLVDQSLVRREEAPPPRSGEAGEPRFREGDGFSPSQRRGPGPGGAEGSRFRMLETIREFAREQLEASGEAERLQREHAHFFLALAQEAEPQLQGPQQPMWLDRLEREQDNVRAALGHFVERGETEAGLQMGAAFWPFWWMRGGHAEGRQRLTQLLQGAGASVRTAAGARVLEGAGRLAHDQDDHAAARKLWEEGLAIARELGDRERIAEALAYLGGWGELEESLAIHRERGDKYRMTMALEKLGNLCEEKGDLKSARAYYEECLAIARECGSPQRIGWSLWQMGNLSRVEGQLQAARSFYAEGLGVFRENRDRFGSGTMLQEMGWVALKQGDWEAARSFFKEAVPLFREMGNKRVLPNLLAGLAKAAQGQGDVERAMEHNQEALVVARETLAQGADNRRFIIYLLAEVARLDGAQGQPRRAVRLLGAVGAIRQAIDRRVTPAERQVEERVLSEARDALGEETFAAAWAAGRAMSLEEAINDALGDRSSSSSDSR